MLVTAVVERVERIATTRADGAAGRGRVESALTDLGQVRAWLDASEADLARTLAAQVSFPEAPLADTSRQSHAAAGRTLERSATLEATPTLAAALDDGRVTASHIDAVTRAAKGLEPDQRDRLLERVDTLADVAAAATVRQFADRVRAEANRVTIDAGMTRLERQRRATRLRSWVDDDGMWNLHGRFDPHTGVKLANRLDATTTALSGDHTPDTAPSDPLQRHHHLQALALARLITGTGVSMGRPEYIVVIDTTTPTTSDGGDGGVPVVEFSIPVEIPWPVLAELADDADIHPIIVRNGVVLHAPGQLDQGRTNRHANRAQRRALHALYTTCAIPGCTTNYHHCKLHHIIWWRNGGRTDLDNLLPVCTQHHHNIHDNGWQLTLGPNRQLTITYPDSTIHNTGPPHRQAR